MSLLPGRAGARGRSSLGSVVGLRRLQLAEVVVEAIEARLPEAAVLGDPVRDVAEGLRALVPDGVDVAVDALGSIATASAATRSLRVQGRQLQIGLLPPALVGDRATVPMHVVIGRELSILGSHGMPAADYPRMLADIGAGLLDPAVLVTRRISLEDVPAALVAMSVGTEPGVTIIEP